MKKAIAGVLLAAILLFGGAAAEMTREEPLEAAAAQLHGMWLIYSGGELLGMGVEFGEDGTLQRYTYESWDGEAESRMLIPDGERIRYAVHAAPEGLYMEGILYALELTDESGNAVRYGLELLTDEKLGGEGFCVYRGEAGGSYYREGQTPAPWETDGWG